jgi:hypothetical protein
MYMLCDSVRVRARARARMCMCMCMCVCVCVCNVLTPYNIYIPTPVEAPFLKLCHVKDDYGGPGTRRA